MYKYGRGTFTPQFARRDLGGISRAWAGHGGMKCRPSSREYSKHTEGNDEILIWILSFSKGSPSEYIYSPVLAPVWLGS